MTRTTFPLWRAAALTAAACGLILAPAAGASARTAVPAAGASAPATALPASFKAASITWLSSSRGWLLGSATCGSTSCADVGATTDGGATWAQDAKLTVPIASGATPSDTGVHEVRFASTSVGWAFGPQLFRTGDDGQTWAQQAIPGHGHQVLALASTADGVYAVVSPCREFKSCSAQTLSLWRANPPASQNWTRIAVKLPINVQASIASFGQTVYVVDPGVPGALYASTDGQHFSTRPSPCDTAQTVGLDEVAPTSATHVAVLCDGNPGISKATKTVYRSVNTGRTYTSAGTTPALGLNAELAASTSGNLLVAAWANGDWMYLNSTGATTWSTPLALGDGGAGFNDLTFASAKAAWVVYGPVSMFSADFGKLYVTHNSGTTWKLITP